LRYPFSHVFMPCFGFLYAEVKSRILTLSSFTLKNQNLLQKYLGQRLPTYHMIVKTKKNNNSCSFIKVSTILFRILHTGIIFKNMYFLNDRWFENCGFSLFSVIN
jgi:hypothetical protein